MPLCIEGYAADEEVNYDDPVAPCYIYLSNITASLTEGSLGFVKAESYFYSAATEKTFVLTCCLQRTDGTVWENYKSKSETYTDTDSETIEKTWFAPSGYNYRTLTVLQVKNSSGTVLETASAASGTVSR